MSLASLLILAELRTPSILIKPVCVYSTALYIPITGLFINNLFCCRWPKTCSFMNCPCHLLLLYIFWVAATIHSPSFYAFDYAWNSQTHTSPLQADFCALLHVALASSENYQLRVHYLLHCDLLNNQRCFCRAIYASIHRTGKLTSLFLYETCNFREGK